MKSHDFCTASGLKVDSGYCLQQFYASKWQAKIIQIFQYVVNKICFSLMETV